MKSFRRLTISTLLAVYILILVGGIVRSTGSGMGCPDWPKCFGSWVPPTSVSELPSNYREVYAAGREQKNIRFAKYLSALGFQKTAEKILTDKSILEEAEFNPTKTWVEYVNRLVGVVIGFLIFAVFIASLKFRKFDRPVTVVAFLTFILVGFQGWIGSIVVSTNLTAWTITVHMVLALVIVCMLVYLIVHTHKADFAARPGISWWLLAGCMAVLLAQIILGTQVREAVDAVAARLPRDSWVANLGDAFIRHRAFSWIVVIFYVGLTYNLIKTQGLKVFPLSVILLILGTILTGVGMAYFSIPAFLQPAHLLLASAAFGLQFMLMLELKNTQAHIKNA
jgi:heme a synthase